MAASMSEVLKALALHTTWMGRLHSAYANVLEVPTATLIKTWSGWGLARGLCSRGFIEEAHARGQKVYYWTVNDVAYATELLALGADGIMTDR